MASHAINSPFSSLSLSSRTKLLVLGSPDGRWDQIRSLQLEHVSPSALKGKEIRGDEPLARMRKWFFSRAPDAGFLLEGFPATLLHAMILDEWLEARHEALDAVVAGPGAPEPVIAHYGALGLLSE
jgi:adenylate kinase